MTRYKVQNGLIFWTDKGLFLYNVATGIFSLCLYGIHVKSDSVRSPFVTYWFEDYILTNTGFAAQYISQNNNLQPFVPVEFCTPYICNLVYVRVRTAPICSKFKVLMQITSWQKKNWQRTRVCE